MSADGQSSRRGGSSRSNSCNELRAPRSEHSERSGDPRPKKSRLGSATRPEKPRAEEPRSGALSSSSPTQGYAQEEREALVAALDSNERRELRLRTRYLSAFTEGFIGIRLRPYQLEAAEAILRSVFARDGETFVVLFARQSGKDEMLANLILFLLARFGELGGSMVCVQPTFRPQTVNAMQRLEARAAQRHFFVEGGFKQSHGYIFRHGLASVTYLSADPSANVVGPTADRLLIINEAQDVAKGIYDKRFAPMAAAGNATRVFSGTAWTADTLLEREKRLALQRQEKDGLQRLFIVDGHQVAHHNRHYGRFLKNEILKLGRDHPLVRTQYFCENVDARSGMFNPAHRFLMRSDIPPLSPPAVSDCQIRDPAGSDCPASLGTSGEIRPLPGQPCAFLLDVAGQEESSTSFDASRGGIELDLNYMNRARDAVTLRVVEIDLSTLETLQAPTYRVVYTQQWTGQNHLTVFGQLKSLGGLWRPEKIVIDATGVGEGLWAMLDKAFPTRVIPVKFSQQLKSELGYGFLAIINTGRFKDCVPTAESDRQYAACESEILVGPARTMRWGVPEGRRDEEGHLIHDDIPVTDSLAAMLDKLHWSFYSPTLIVQGRDPLPDMDSNF